MEPLFTLRRNGAALAILGSAVVLLLWRQQQRTPTLELQTHAMAAVEESERRFRSVAQSAGRPASPTPPPPVTHPSRAWKPANKPTRGPPATAK